MEALVASDQHPNVVRFLSLERDESFVYLALELCTRGTFVDLVDAVVALWNALESGDDVGELVPDPIGRGRAAGSQGLRMLDRSLAGPSGLFRSHAEGDVSVDREAALER